MKPKPKSKSPRKKDLEQLENLGLEKILIPEILAIQDYIISQIIQF